MWTVVAIFALGLAVMIGLFLSPRHRTPAPTTMPLTMPMRPSIDIGR